jgi:serine/threonine protein kinase
MEEGTLLDFFQHHPGEVRTAYVSTNTTRLRASKTDYCQILGTIRGLAFIHSLGVVHGDIKAVRSSSLVKGELMHFLRSMFSSTANAMLG